MKGDDDASRYERIYAVVRQIPEGHVATYGQVASLAGLPGHDDLRAVREQRADTLADHEVVVDHENSHRSFHPLPPRRRRALCGSARRDR